MDKGPLICEDFNMAHHHGHPGRASKGIRLAFLLNLGFTLLELVGGLLTNSTAILADAVHDLGDSFGLGQAWYFERLASRGRKGPYTYGYRRFSLLGALISAVFLILGSLFVLSRAVPRLIHPEQPHAPGMVVLAVIGVAVNGFAWKRLTKEAGLSSRTIALHLLEDVLGWLAVLLVAGVLLVKDIPVLDPALAVLITLYVLGRLAVNLRTMLPIFLQAAPKGLDMDAIAGAIGGLPRVRSVHHMHVWSLDGTRNVFSVHIVADRDLDAADYRRLKEEVREVVKGFGIVHSTVEIEFPEEACRVPEDAC